MDGKVTRGNFLKGKTAKRILAIGFLALTCIAVLGGTAFAAFSRGSVMLQPAAIGAQAVLSGAEEVQVSEMLAASHPFSVINLRTSGNYSQPGQRFSLPIGRGLTLPNGSDAPDGDAPIMLLLDAGASLLGSAESADETGAVDEVNTDEAGIVDEVNTEEAGIVDEVNAEGAEALTESNTEKAEAVIEAIAEKFAEEELAEAVDEAESELFVMALGAEPAESASFSITQSKAESYMNNVPGTVQVYVDGEADPVTTHNTFGTQSYTGVITVGTPMRVKVTAPTNYAIASVTLSGGELTPMAEYDANSTPQEYTFSFAAGQSINVVITQRTDNNYFTFRQCYEGTGSPSNYGSTTLSKGNGNSLPFYVDQTNGKVNNPKITSGSHTLTGRYTSNQDAWGSIEAVPEKGYFVKHINVYVNGSLDSDALNYESTPYSGSSWKISFSDSFAPALGSHVEISVVYGANFFTFTQRYEGIGSPSNYGSTTLSRVNGALQPFYVDQNNGYSNNPQITSGSHTLTGRYTTNNDAWGGIKAVPEKGYFVKHIDVYVNGSLDSNALDYESSPYSGSSWEISFSNSFAPALGSHVEISVVYGTNSFTFTQRYEGAGSPSNYGSTTLSKGNGNSLPFYVEQFNSNFNEPNITSESHTLTGRYTTNKDAWGSITAAPASGYFIGSINVYVDETGGDNFGDSPFEGALDYDHSEYDGNELNVKFSDSFNPPLGSHVKIEVVYSKNLFTLTQRFEGIGSPSNYGSTTLNKGDGRPQPFYVEQSNGVFNNPNVTSEEGTLTGRYTTNKDAWGSITAAPASGYFIGSINVYVDETGGSNFGDTPLEGALDYDNSEYVGGNLNINFSDSFDPALGSHVKIEVVYSKNLFTLTQRFEGIGSPSSYGSTTLNRGDGRPLPFYVDQHNAVHNNPTITSGEETLTGRYTTNNAWGSVTATPASGYFISSINVYVDETGGNNFGDSPFEGALDYDSSEYVGGNLNINFSDSFDPALGSHVKIEVVYSKNLFTLTQRFEGIGSPSNYGSTTLYKGNGRPLPFYVDQHNAVHNNPTITSVEETLTGLYTTNKDAWGSVTATPASGYFISSINVYVDETGGNNFGDSPLEGALDYEHAEYVGSKVNVRFSDSFSPSLGSHVKIEVVYSKNLFTLTQRFEGIGSPGNYGSTTLHRGNGRPLPFYVDQHNAVHNNLTITSVEETLTGRYTTNNDAWGSVTATPVSGYSVKDIKVYVDPIGGNSFGEPMEGALVYSSGARSAAGKWTGSFAPSFDPPMGSHVMIVAEYTDWGTYALSQKYDSTVSPAPATFGTVLLTGSKSFIVDGSGMVITNPVLTSIESSETGTIQPSELSEDGTAFTNLKKLDVTPPAGCSVKEVVIKVDGTQVTDALDTAASKQPVGGKWELVFASDYAIEVGSSLEIAVTYTTLYTVTLAQENLVQGGLGTVTLTADGESAATFTGTTASDSRSIVSGTTLSGLTVTPPDGLTVLSASSNLNVSGKDAVTLNTDGTVSIAPIVPNKDVTIEIKYGSRMYVKSNQAGVVTVDSTAATTDFAKFCDLVAPTKTVSITALNGWVIKSVKYGTDSGSQSTPVTATSDSYEITSIASDIYLDVEVERDIRRLSAKLDGEGGASIVYGGTTTALTDAFNVIDSDIQIDSTVSFETIADANSEITDVTLNGVSLGNTRSFTMPESDSVIVVHTKLKEFDIKAVLTGDGEAQAVYGGTTTTLDTTAKVVAADVVTGSYDITFAPLAGSEIVSVSVDGTPITPNTDNVYSVAVTADDVLVTVETRKIPEYTINAKASVAGAAKANGTDLTADYSEILTALKGEDATLTFAIDPQYTLVEVKCGDTPDALAAITLTDMAYSFEELASDKYVEVLLEDANRPVITVNRTGDGVIYTNGGSADVSNTSYSVDSGSDHSFDFIPLDGAQILKVTVKIGDNTPVTVYDPANSVNVPVLKKALNTAGKSSHSIENITENVTINAEFTTLPEYKLHLIKEGEGEGTFDFDGTSYTASFDADVTHGSTPSITIKAKKGSKLESVKVGDSAESAVKVELTDSVLTLPEINGDVYVVVSLKKELSSGGVTPETGDDGTGVILTAVAANLFILSGLACTAIMQKRRRDRKQQEA